MTGTQVPLQCPECGAAWRDGQTCQDAFHLMLFWEAETPAYGEVHHLTVLCYHLQHPSLYSPEGLREGLRLLATFLDEGLTPQQVVKRQRDRVASDRRKWKIKATASSHGAYDRPMAWTMTALDVVAGGAQRYCENVRRWAASIRAAR